MRYAWTKQAAIYIVCTHVYACVSDLYYSVSITLKQLLHTVLPSFQRVPRQLYADISAEICDKHLQCRDTKIEIPDEVLIQSR